MGWALLHAYTIINTKAKIIKYLSTVEPQISVRTATLCIFINERATRVD